MKILNYILGVACLILLILCIIFGGGNSKKDKIISSLQKEIYTYQHTPIKWVEKTKLNYYFFDFPVSVPYKVVESDTSLTIPYKTLAQRFTEKKYYADSVKFGDGKTGGMIGWKAFVTMNNLVDIKLDPVLFKHTDSIGTKTIDTCIMKPPAYKPKNHLILAIMMSGINTKQFPNTSAMIKWDIKDRVGLGIGGEYNSYHSEFYLKAGIDIYLK